ncbi:hypothetical protein [Streptomyces sp. NPDC047043]|uniref:hypothetical protein n=1 Tax=Streptomyces sp. NPDC047043 TaxID=3154497 RepID=UPI003403DBDC
MLEDLGDLVGASAHQPLAGDELAGERAGAWGLEQVGGVPQHVLADLGRAARLAAVAVRGGLDEKGVPGREALQVAAGPVTFDHADVLVGPGIQPVGQVLRNQRGQEHRRQGDVQRNSVTGGEHSDDQADEADDSDGQPQGHAAGVGQADAPAGTLVSQRSARRCRRVAAGVSTPT